ncbi:nickel-dependent hydrogenase large subunit [Caloramator sp. mosi_1]|uniref:nickel-dependent hydrogenase large subunit n=1 Tax=Caloramator sp. mosi_1 TaxID=3023090 RepID=UPI00236155D9|nr:nickel-dependent hydrogenase large subunit [Caloramator sp. mosi_1]WDC85670.1 nickel-dependent hydrogenase large subunit [Caloramator sp. mosi_1]
MKAPRYANEPYEAGPLARMWINGEYRKGISVMDRHIARMLESKKIAQALSVWIDQVIPGTVDYASSLHTLVSGEGIGLTEAPRGALLHYIKYSNGSIDNYQIITPTCWNASPTDAKGVLGPIEKALIGVEVKDANNPIELIRIVHSFDPCTACAVHVINPTKK